MSKLRFMGTLKEIEYPLSLSKKLKFIPDQECAVVEKDSKDETKFVVHLPVDDRGGLSKGEGSMFVYDKEVCICLETSKVEWLPTWKLNGHYKIVMQPNEKEARGYSKLPEDSNDISMSAEGGGRSKQFQLVFMTSPDGRYRRSPPLMRFVQ